MSSQPDFTSLSEGEQRLVAERLKAIADSGWKPFWCPDAECDGYPHWQFDKTGAPLYVSPTDTVGPIGQPLSDLIYEDSETGEWYLPESGIGETGDQPVARAVLDPKWAHNHARVDQRLPNWLDAWTLFIMSGRGSGKTRTGVEFVTLCARRGLDGAILGRRGTELVNTHVAEILKYAHPEFMPKHWPSRDTIEWPNGAITYLFSAEKPENIRSVNLSYAWVDEAAFMDEIETAWMNLTMATRVSKPGNPIHFLITSTPTGTPWVMKMEDDPDVEVRRVSTYANRANLDKGFLETLIKNHEGTRMGRQEIHGEVLRDVEGALWNDGMFKYLPQGTLSGPDFLDYLDGLDSRVLAIDPAGSKGKNSDATGIIGVGTHIFDDDGSYLPVSTYSVLARATLKGTPTEWARQAFKAARLIKADRIIAEKNYGGDMVKQVLQDFAKLYPTECLTPEGDSYADCIEVVHAVQNKETRAESAVGRYEQGRVTHIVSDTAFGDLSELEKQQVTWVPKSRGGRMASPNDIDALVWAIRELESKVRYDTSMASGGSALSKLKRTGSRAPVTPGPIRTGLNSRPPGVPWGNAGRRFPVRRAS